MRKQKSEESAIVRAPQSRDRSFCFDWFAPTMSAIFLRIEQNSEGPQNNADWLILIQYSFVENSVGKKIHERRNSIAITKQEFTKNLAN